LPPDAPPRTRLRRVRRDVSSGRPAHAAPTDRRLSPPLRPHRGARAPPLLARLDDGPAGRASFDPRGERLAVASADGRAVRFLDARSGKALSAPWPLKAPLVDLAWHPAGKFLAAACDDFRIYVWDTTRRQPAAVLEGFRNGGL